MGWPHRGVYFSHEPGEAISWSGSGQRVVRIGTHALNVGSTTKLWGRLRGHFLYARSGIGNHRGSIFRLILGIALSKRDIIPLPESWGITGDPGKAAQRLGLPRTAVLEDEAELEARVSRYIGQMPLLWINVDDAPGPDSERGFIERNAIALLSGYVARASDHTSNCGSADLAIGIELESPGCGTTTTSMTSTIHYFWRCSRGA